MKNDFLGGIRVVLTAMLMSPNFLYRWETVPRGHQEGRQLPRASTRYEMASRLSYAFYASMPDQGLFDAAAGDKLQTPAQIEEQVRRMLKDPKAKDGLGDFVVQWLDVSDLKDAVKAPQYAMLYTPAVAEAMLAESKEMLAGVLAKGRQAGHPAHRQGRLRRRRAGQDLPGRPASTGTELRETTLNATSARAS